MESVWISMQALRHDELRFGNRCVVCGARCEERIRIGAVPTDMATGGIRFLLGLVRTFDVPVHKNRVCDKEAIQKLRKLELYPLGFFVFSAIGTLFLSILIDPSMFLVAFGAFAIYLAIAMYLESRKDWPIRIVESPATGSGGAYEFELRNEEYADDFRSMNVDMLLEGDKSR